MSFIFKRGSKLILDDGENRYQLLVSDFSFSETFLEQGYNQATLHDPNAIENYTYSNAKSNATFQFDMYFSDSKVVENRVLEWYGFSQTGDFPTRISSLSNTLNLYIDMGTYAILIDSAVLENLSFKLDPRGVLALNVTGSGVTTTEQGVSLPTTGTLYTQEGFSNNYLTASIGGQDVTNVSGITLELTKSVEWVNTQTVHDALSNTLYIKDRFTATNLSVSGTISTIKTTDSEPKYVNNTQLLIGVGDYMLINLNSCNITERVSVDSGILSKVADYKLLNSVDSTIII